MKLVFADTYYFLARLNAYDPHRARVLAYAGRVQARLLTTEWVLLELADALAATRFRTQLNGYLQHLTALAVVIRPDRELWEEALKFYHQHDDKAWSLTDCLSFVVMRRNGVTTALTGDHHLKQAGFDAVFL